MAISHPPKLTKIAQKVFEGLEQEEKPVKPEELVTKLGMNLRSVRYGLKILLDANLIDRYPDLVDLRSFYYLIHQGPTSSQKSHQSAISA